MPEQDVIDLLKKDFETLSEEYEQDHFAQRIQYKLFARQRARMGVIGFAGGIGAALAASQMPTIVATVTPAVINEPAMTNSLFDPQLLATALLATLLFVTVLIVRQED